MQAIAERPAFSELKMAGLACGILALPWYLFPRLDLSARVGRGAFPWEPGILALGSLWGGVLCLAPAIAQRRPWLGVFLFMCGWSCAALGAAQNVSTVLQPLLVIADFRLGLPRTHPMFWLDVIARLTDAPLPLALVVGVARAGIRTSPWRILLVAALAGLTVPAFWFASALLEAAIPVRGVMIHSLNFLLLLGHFALWGVLPWLALPRSVERGWSRGVDGATKAQRHEEGGE